MTARGTDWGLAALLAMLLATGALTLFAGGSGDAWVFAAHDALGVAITLLLIVKLRRVWQWLARGRLTAGLIAAASVATVLLTGFIWAGGATTAIAGYSLLAWHEALGVAVLLIVVAHMAVRAKPLRARDAGDRRQFLTVAGIAAGSFAAWYAQRPVQALFGLRGAKRRFTGSYEAGSFDGNSFPTTSWVADGPRPVDRGSYRLRVGGLVDAPRALSLSELEPIDELTATLDCTGGFYSTQHWRGVRLGRLLQIAGVQPSARHVRVVSGTGYRWSFALADARELLLASYVGGEPLSHGHGAPVRLVVPGARGFQWVKWVERVDLLDSPDYGAPASTVWSSFTRAGRGDA